MFEVVLEIPQFSNFIKKSKVSLYIESFKNNYNISPSI